MTRNARRERSALFEEQVSNFDRPTLRLHDVRFDLSSHASPVLDDKLLQARCAGHFKVHQSVHAKFNVVIHGVASSHLNAAIQKAAGMPMRTGESSSCCKESGEKVL
jgi:hypothetical protein